MDPTSIASRFQTDRLDAIGSVALAQYYLDALLWLYERYIRRHIPHVDAYDRAQRLIWRIRTRYGEGCSLEQCSYCSLSSWETKQRWWREFDQDTYELSLLPDLPDCVIESCTRQYDALDNPNAQ